MTGVPDPALIAAAIVGVLALLAVTVTKTGSGIGSGGLYSKKTALGDAESVGGVVATASGAAATAHKQSLRARDPWIFMLILCT